MKNTRKKLLVSSVAALLVSAMALSTATFAWFTSSTKVTAEGLGVQTTKSSELKISKNDLAWSDGINYNFTGEVLKPATSSDGENWYSSVAAAKSASTSNGTYDKIAGENLDNFVFVDMLNVKNAGGADCNDVKITMTSNTTSEFVRVAVVPVDVQTEAGADKMPSASANFSANIYGAAKDDAWKPYNGKALVSSDYKTADVINGKEISVGTMTPNEVKSYKVLVWFEGEDSDCYDLTTSSLTAPKIGFSVTGSSSTAN